MTAHTYGRMTEHVQLRALNRRITIDKLTGSTPVALALANMSAE